MPSVMDLINFQANFKRMGTLSRNQMITDSIARLESDVRPSVKSEHLSHLVNFENELQQFLNEKTIDEGKLQRMCSTYATFPFFERFLQKIR
jgi:hypothetical protein